MTTGNTPYFAPTAGAKPEEVALIAAATDSMDYPGYLMRIVEARSEAYYHTLSQRSDVTPRQISILLALHQLGNASQAQLADFLRQDRSSLSEIMGRLVKRELIARTTSETDRRAVSLQLTDSGREVLFGELPLLIRAQEWTLSHLDPEYRSIFMKCLRTLAFSDPVNFTDSA